VFVAADEESVPLQDAQKGPSPFVSNDIIL
jgi:hypothetical protein